MWEAGAAGALIDYRILIKPAADCHRSVCV
jgi:hypothetical protein